MRVSLKFRSKITKPLMMGSHTGSSRFNLGCQSLDRLYAVWRPTGYNTQAAPILMTGMKQGGTAGATGDIFVAATSAGSPTVDYGSSFGRPLMEDPQFNGEKWISKYFNYPKPSGYATGQFNINGTLYPQWGSNFG